MIEPLSNVEGINDKRQTAWDQYMAWRAHLIEGQTQPQTPAVPSAPHDSAPDAQPPLAGGDQGATEAQERKLEELRRRDREVRQHEQAHLKAAGRYALGGAHYVYVRGPDGRMYAVDGEVMIDVSPVEGDPRATLQKAQQLRRAALAPTDPSPQDQNVAARASQMEQEARREILEEMSDELDQSSSPVPLAMPQPYAAAPTNDIGRSVENAQADDKVQRLIKDTPELVGLDTVDSSQHADLGAEKATLQSEKARLDSSQSPPGTRREFLV